MTAEINFPNASQSISPPQNIQITPPSPEPKITGLFNKTLTSLNSSLFRNTLAAITFSAVVPVANAQEENQGVSEVETLNLVIAGLAFTFAVAGWITAKRSTNVARRSHEAAVMANSISEAQYYPDPLKGLLSQQITQFILAKSEVEALKSDSTLCISHRRLYRWYYEWKAENYVNLKNHVIQLCLESLQKEDVSKENLEEFLLNSCQKGLLLLAPEKKLKVERLGMTSKSLVEEIKMSLELLEGKDEVRIDV